MRQNAFGGRAPPGPAGELVRSSDLLTAIVECLILRGRERKGKREGRGWEGGREEGWEGREGRGLTTCIPHYF